MSLFAKLFTYKFVIPAATITFCGEACIQETGEAPPELLQAVFAFPHIVNQLIT
jgi:hypothetical protein